MNPLQKDTANEELACWLGFSALTSTGIGPKKIIALYEQLNSLIPVWKGTRTVLERFKMFTPRMIDKFLEKREYVDTTRLVSILKEKGVKAYPIFHPEYPFRLKQIYDPPLVLYVKGNIQPSDLDRCVSVVGTRRPSSYGQRMAKDIARGLAKSGVLVVSGMALGIDSYAHRAAIEGGGKTVAVVASGVDLCFPSSNKPLYEMLISGDHGAVVSEYFPGTKPEKWMFPARNRIISGLASGVVVVEAGEKSGALITARLGFEQSREVFAVPGRIDSPASIGSNWLIKNNTAHLLTKYEEVLEELKWVVKDTGEKVPTIVELFGREKELYDLISNEPQHFDVLCEKTGMPAGELSASLTMLELAGVVSRLPGDWYVREVQG